jgi:hypothetical protein
MRIFSPWPEILIILSVIVGKVMSGLWSLRGALFVQNYDRWLELKDTLSTFTLTDNQDSVIWVLDKSRKFTTKSLYRFLTDRGVTSKVVGYIWKCKDPLKIQFFLWQIFNNKLQVGQSLTKRRWHGSGNCCICGCPETVDHILSRCFLAKYWGDLDT